jgi:molybdopterin-guanine dinucleotide biosynthesis protein A
MDIEAVVLTGGASSRMGTDKASLPVDGEPTASRIVRLLQETGIPTTILGPGGVPDATPTDGPLAALAAFAPSQPWLFVASCDLPRFDARIVPFLYELAPAGDGAVPLIDGRLQPLCGVYRSTTLLAAAALHCTGVKRIMAWVDMLSTVRVGPEALSAAGLDPRCVQGANTPEEWRALVQG